MKILVTGAAGDIGSRVTTALLERGHQVKALVRRVEGTGWLKKAGAAIHIGDVTKPETLGGICDDVDVVYHFSAVLWVANPKKVLKEVNYLNSATTGVWSEGFSRSLGLISIQALVDFSAIDRVAHMWSIRHPIPFFTAFFMV